MTVQYDILFSSYFINNTIIQYGTILLVVLGITWFISSCIYAVTLHPLARFPGPISTAVSRLPWWYHLVIGNQVRFTWSLHQKYGPVVRVSPWELSYADDGQAMRDICSHEKGRLENSKAREFHGAPQNGVRNLLSADQKDHSRVRRVLSPAFSDRALKQQEPLFQKHANLLVSQLAKHCHDGQIDMARLLNFTTFDIMGDLTFGEPLRLLENQQHSSWLDLVFKAVKALPYVQIIQYYPLLNIVAHYLEPQFIKSIKWDHWNFTASRMRKRMQRTVDRPDIWSLILAAQGSSKALTEEEMESNAELFMIAGSETTATLLSGVVFMLTQNPQSMDLLVKEVRSMFSDDKDITMERLAGLRYLNACLSEALRLYPPVPVGSPRIIPEGGAKILGQWIPPRTWVSVSQYSSYRSPANFADADKFVPERWLKENSRFVNDKLDGVLAFSYGPRNCLGQNMAWHEMRLVLAKLFYHYDVDLSAESLGWLEQDTYLLWEKQSLMCRIKAVSV